MRWEYCTRLDMCEIACDSGSGVIHLFELPLAQDGNKNNKKSSKKNTLCLAIAHCRMGNYISILNMFGTTRGNK